MIPAARIRPRIRDAVCTASGAGTARSYRSRIRRATRSSSGSPRQPPPISTSATSRRQRRSTEESQLIGPLGPGTTIAIPYDFDFSGLVDAPYASAPDELRINSVRERKYRGYCAHNAEALAAARQMREMRPQMIAALTSVPGLDPGTQKKAISYLDGFFATDGSDADAQAKILNRCVG